MWNLCQRSVVPSPAIFIWFARVLASNVWKTNIKVQSQRYESSQKSQIKTSAMKFHLKVYQRVVAKHSTSRSLSPQDLLSHINISMVSFLQSLLLLFHFCIFLSQLSELVWKLAEEISLQSASKRFPSFGPPANGNKSNAKKSRFCPNRNLTGTIYHWSVILRSFSVVLNSAKHDANGFFKVLLLSSHLSRHPVQKSVWCTRSNGNCSFNLCRFFFGCFVVKDSGAPDGKFWEKTEN